MPVTKGALLHQLVQRLEALEDRVAQLEQAQRPAARKPAERKQEG